MVNDHELSAAARSIRVPVFLSTLGIMLIVISFITQAFEAEMWFSTLYFLSGAFLLVLGGGFGAIALVAYVDLRKIYLEERAAAEDDSDDLMIPPGFSPPPSRFDSTAPPPPQLDPAVSMTDEQWIRIRRFGFSPSDWRLLLKLLQRNEYKWQRQVLDDSKLFKNITAPNVFNDITKKFAAADVIDGKPRHYKVTEEGVVILHAAANLNIITSRRS